MNLISQQLREWSAFYQEHFGITIDPQLAVPKKPAQGAHDFNRTIVVAQGMTAERVLRACEKFFPCHCPIAELDLKTAGRNERDTTKDYVVWSRNGWEPDYSNRFWSADKMKNLGKTTMTLTERLLLELKCFIETGRHLDHSRWVRPEAYNSHTLCAGSRFDNGFVPVVNWDGFKNKLQVNWSSPKTTRHFEAIARSVIV